MLPRDRSLHAPAAMTEGGKNQSGTSLVPLGDPTERRKGGRERRNLRFLQLARNVLYFYREEKKESQRDSEELTRNGGEVCMGKKRRDEDNSALLEGVLLSPLLLAEKEREAPLPPQTKEENVPLISFPLIRGGGKEGGGAGFISPKTRATPKEERPIDNQSFLLLNRGLKGKNQALPLSLPLRPGLHRGEEERRRQ